MPTTTQAEAPGLVWRKRRNGAPAAYWIASRSYIRAGYTPKAVRLHYEPGDPMLAARCHVLQAEMLSWATETGRKPVYFDGTFASLIRFWETHPDSSYFEVEPETQRVYSKTMALLMEHKGKRMVSAVDGSDIKRWYKELCDAKSVSWAYYTVNVLKIALSFGSSKRISACRILRQELRDVKFRAGPKAQKHQITFEQVNAFSKAAHEIGAPWMALCLRLQFNFGLRRRDVIGKWVKDAAGTDGIRNRRKVWRDGLTWADIDANGILLRSVSKTRNTSGAIAVHSVHDYPDLKAELALHGYPQERRVGPIVIHSKTGLPPTDAQCRRYFRRIALKSGIPFEVKNRHARQGAITEAYLAGATENERMALGSHTEADTNWGYVSEVTEMSRSAARKRVASRGKNSERD